MSWGKAWLNYSYQNSINEVNKSQQIDVKIKYLSAIYYNQEDKIIRNAIKELQLALSEMFHITPCIYEPVNRAEKIKEFSNLEDDSYLEKELEVKSSGIRLEIVPSLNLHSVNKTNKPNNEAYTIDTKGENIYIQSISSIGILYGVFHLIRLLKLDYDLDTLSIKEVPKNPYRMLNHWDNMDGTIERGYAGSSFFFQENHILVDERIIDYARMISSIGINGVVINNVNVKGAATDLITDRYFRDLRKLSDIFLSYGITLYLSLNYAAPMELGGLDTADPLDEEVIAWWKERMKIVYEHLPDFGGFLVKADSEGRPGPFTYQRTHADGANMLGNAIKEYGGIIIWRCFVYNCMQDWRDKKTDRARAAFDHFKPLDGEFVDNVILQIKNGPMDFQVREPVSPLFGELEETNQMLEVQITQEYTGQQRHVCYLVPMWKEVLDFNTYCKTNLSKVSDIVSGNTFSNMHCGIAGVTNLGNDENWTGHDLAAANLYGFGRLCWDTELPAEDIAREWITLTYSNESIVLDHILGILMKSWTVYEKYTSPLGIGWMVNPSHHYGPNVDGYEYDRWGTYHRADHKGIGVDRSSKGTGYASLYHYENAIQYETIEECPEELLLFFHYVTYDYVLSTGKTLIQHIYDTHFEGVVEVEEMIDKWKELNDFLEKSSYERVLLRLEEQLTSAKEWRDQINSYFYRKSGIEDEQHRIIY